jgi:hypothetical protein
MNYYIGEIEKYTGISQSRIRYYEDKKLIRFKREPNTNRRIFTDFDIKQLKLIYNLIHINGFTIESIKYMANKMYCWNFFNCKNKKCEKYMILEKCFNKSYEKEYCNSCIIYLNQKEKELDTKNFLKCVCK